MTEKKFNCCDQATNNARYKTTDKAIDKIRQKVVYSSYNEVDKIMKKKRSNTPT